MATLDLPTPVTIDGQRALTGITPHITYHRLFPQRVFGFIACACISRPDRVPYRTFGIYYTAAKEQRVYSRVVSRHFRRLEHIVSPGGDVQPEPPSPVDPECLVRGYIDSLSRERACVEPPYHIYDY